MSNAAAFQTVCSELEARTSLSTLEARGTVRLALKQAGFDAKSVSPAQLAVVVRKLLPAELLLRGIDRGPALCEGIAGTLATNGPDADPPESPEDVFRRLASR
ncbi:MAG: hypothetical protein ABFS46_13860 [Myxococcota bacterium]